ncbi:MAG: hypothetical protein K9G62_05340 [Alphaproteobacteria bacterium]|nr:hypothetical protein [Alphaproteobacteria bacterium]
MAKFIHVESEYPKITSRNILTVFNARQCAYKSGHEVTRLPVGNQTFKDSAKPEPREGTKPYLPHIKSGGIQPLIMPMAYYKGPDL